jgi:hypothetical protein
MDPREVLLQTLPRRGRRLNGGSMTNSNIGPSASLQTQNYSLSQPGASLTMG